MLFFLIAGHALADYAWQSDAMATCKCPESTNPLQKQVRWYYWLGAHSLIHGGVVGAIVRVWGFSTDAAVTIGIAETIIHIVIDWGKCRGWYGMAIDQSLHVACKVAWVILLARGFVS